MFNSLQYDVVFPSTGRRLKNELVFSAGLSAITGPNEAGKSFVLEMCRFGLFGADALRGKASEYKSLNNTLRFTVRGETYTAIRTLRQATLSKDVEGGGVEMLATGITAVNEKILKILGFSLAVFDVSCSANQGEVERLSNMRPTERKRMIDSVIGIGALEVLAKWAGDEATLRDREASGMSAALVAPTPPGEPEGYRPAEEIAAEIKVLEKQDGERRDHKAFLAQTRTEPTRPTCDIPLPAENIAPLAEAQATRRSEIAKAKMALVAIGDIKPKTTEEIDELEARMVRFEAYRSAQRQLAGMVTPPHTRAELREKILPTWKEIEAFEVRAAKVPALKKRIEAVEAHEIECPACEYHWIPGGLENVAALRAELANAEKAVGDCPATPAITARQAESYLKDWDKIDPDLIADLKAVPAETDPGVDARAISRLRQEITTALHKAALTGALSALEAADAGQPDFTQMLAKRRAYETSLESFRVASVAYDGWLIERQDRVAKLSLLGGVEEKLSAARAAHTAAIVFERERSNYTTALEKFTVGRDRVAVLAGEAEQYRKIRAAFTKLRVTVKAQLLPSLNLAASRMLSDMTGGQRNIVFVDDDFDIMIDGQNIDTLSGSGKACANLALRLALGQVLTNRVFSVFLGDEIDASMDEFRAEQTALTLRMLKNRVSQVLLVSHKQVEADHTHVLGEPLVEPAE